MSTPTALPHVSGGRGSVRDLGPAAARGGIARPALLLGPGDHHGSSTGDVVKFLCGDIKAGLPGGMRACSPTTPEVDRIVLFDCLGSVWCARSRGGGKGGVEGRAQTADASDQLS